MKMSVEEIFNIIDSYFDKFDMAWFKTANLCRGENGCPDWYSIRLLDNARLEINEESIAIDSLGGTIFSENITRKRDQLRNLNFVIRYIEGTLYKDVINSYLEKVL